METLVAPFFNFFVLVAAMVYFLRQPLKQFVLGRHEFLRDELQRVRQMLGEAQKQHGEFSSKLKAIDAEVASLREQNRQEAAASKSRVINEAQRLAVTIL